MGRVDGLVMHVGEEIQPRITHIEVGGPTLWSESIRRWRARQML